MVEKRKRGRPATSRNVVVIPEFREEPDIEKLARALIMVAMSKHKKEMEETNKSPEVSLQNDSVETDNDTGTPDIF